MANASLPIHVDIEAVVASVLKTVRLDVQAIRAEVAEGIAKAIEALDDRGYAMYRSAYDEAAEVARGYVLADKEAP